MMIFNLKTLWFVVILLVGVLPVEAATYSPLTTNRGVVAADNELASQAGAAVLAKGGTALDAAVATAFALGVVSPSSSGIGGGGFAVIYVAKEKKFIAIDFREVGPSSISPSHYLKNGVLDPQLSRKGGLAVGVPGEVAGLEMIWKEGGVLPWKELVSPAQELADKGFQVSWFLGWVAQRVTKELPETHWLRRWLSPMGKILSSGRKVKRSKLADTLARIAAEGSAGFYQGAVAKDIVETVQSNGGVITLKDLAQYRALKREVVTGQFRENKIVTFPLPSSGGLLLLEMFGILDAGKFDLAKHGPRSSWTLHVLAELLKHGFADRSRFMGDTGNSQGIVKKLLLPSRLLKIAKRIRNKRVQKHKTYGTPSLGTSASAPTDRGTSHLCVMDAQGNAVALTTTVNGYFGSSLVGKKSGIVLNNQMDDFSLETGKPNMFGLVQSEANLVGPGKRPLSSMTPTLVLGKNGIVGCYGGSGGPRIISGTFQVMLNVLIHGQNVQEAVSASRIHHQWLPNILGVEKDTASDVVKALKKRGHAVQLASYLTAVQAITRKGKEFQAASDPRKGGHPAAAQK